MVLTLPRGEVQGLKPRKMERVVFPAINRRVSYCQYIHFEITEFYTPKRP